MKCYFIGLDNCYDIDIKERIYNAIESIIEENEKIDFFVYYTSSFINSCLSVVKSIKEKYPQKDITTNKITDSDEPLNLAYNLWTRGAAERERALIDNLISEAELELDYSKSKDNYKFRYDLKERLIIEKCDCLITYNYFELYAMVNKIIKPFLKTKRIISAASPESAAFITESYNRLSEKECYVMNEVQKGRSLASISGDLNVSAPRVRQIAMSASRKLKSMLLMHNKDLQNEK